MAYTQTISTPPARTVRDNREAQTSEKSLLDRTKKVSYTTTSDQIFAMSETASATATAESIPSRIEIQNVGDIPLSIMLGYETYTDDTTDGDTEYLHTMLMYKYLLLLYQQQLFHQNLLLWL